MGFYDYEFCPYCGSPLTTTVDDERERDWCENCEQIIYHNPHPTASVCVVDDQTVLLIKRDIPPDRGEWGVPAGFIELDETPEVAASRELREETSLSVDPSDLTLLDTVTSKHPDGRRIISIGYVVSRAEVSGEVTSEDEVTSARFWDVEKLYEDASETIRSHDRDRINSAINYQQSR